MPANLKRVKEIFLEAVENTKPEERHLDAVIERDGGNCRSDLSRWHVG